MKNVLSSSKWQLIVLLRGCSIPQRKALTWANSIAMEMYHGIDHPDYILQRAFEVLSPAYMGDIDTLLQAVALRDELIKSITAINDNFTEQSIDTVGTGVLSRCYNQINYLPAFGWFEIYEYANKCINLTDTLFSAYMMAWNGSVKLSKRKRLQYLFGHYPAGETRKWRRFAVDGTLSDEGTDAISNVLDTDIWYIHRQSNIGEDSLNCVTPNSLPYFDRQLIDYGRNRNAAIQAALLRVCLFKQQLPAAGSKEYQRSIEKNRVYPQLLFNLLSFVPKSDFKLFQFIQHEITEPEMANRQLRRELMQGNSIQATVDSNLVCIQEADAAKIPLNNISVGDDFKA